MENTEYMSWTEYREAAHKLLDLCLDIQETGNAGDGYPFADIHVDNYTRAIYVYLNPDGFGNGTAGLGGCSIHLGHPEKKTYRNCLERLEELAVLAKEKRSRERALQGNA